MTTATWSIYRQDNGLFLPRREVCDAADLVDRVPEGCAAIEGEFDYLSQRIDVAASPVVVIDHQPPAPSDTEMHSWAWDTTARRWFATPTFAANKAARVAPVQLAIEALEREQQRPLREIALAVASGDAPAIEAVERLAEIETGIAALRAVRTAMTEAASQESLDAIAWP